MKRGAVLNIVRKSVEVACLAKDIPSTFSLDLTGKDVNDSLKWSDVVVPESVTPTIQGRDFCYRHPHRAFSPETRTNGAAREAARSGGGEEE